MDAFLIGLSSGNRFPTQQTHLPWATIVGYCDTLFPQTYWRSTTGTGKDRRVIPVHDGTPQSTVDLAMTAWSTIKAGRRVVPTGGPLSLCSAEDLVAFAGVAEARGWDEIHYYIDELGVEDAKYEEIAKV